MQSPQGKLKEIRRILTLWPSQAADEGDDLVRAYLLAVDDYPADDVTMAVDTLVKGVAPGVNPGFRPKPSEVGAECRRQMNLRLEREARGRTYRPKLPAPDIAHSPESRARVAALVAAAVGSLTGLPRNVTVGDPEDHEAAA